MESADRLAELIDIHIKDAPNDPDRCWVILESELSGRGVFAVRDIEPGEVIFREKPLLISPTARSNAKLNSCTICCGKLNEVDFVCVRGCTLPVCENCVNGKQHLAECELYRSWKPIEPNSVDRRSLRALTTIRGLLLDDTRKDLIYALQANTDPSYRNEIRNAAKCFENFPSDGKTVEYLHRIVAVLNTNAFEAFTKKDGHETVLRGLYPLAGVMNHECTPNTCHVFEPENIMAVKATRKIPKGGELFSTYTKMLWSNLSRKLFLTFTKQFKCQCPRCLDPTENGTYLSALLCRAKNCPGWIIPTSCEEVSPWRCIKCANVYELKEISRTQNLILTIANSKTKSDSISDVISFINEKIPKLCPPTNQFVIEMKLHCVWGIERSSKNLTEKDINYVIQYCNDVLLILDRLEAGECTLKFMLLDAITKFNEVLSEIRLGNSKNPIENCEK